MRKSKLATATTIAVLASYSVGYLAYTWGSRGADRLYITNTGSEFLSGPKTRLANKIFLPAAKIEEKLTGRWVAFHEKGLLLEPGTDLFPAGPP